MIGRTLLGLALLASLGTVSARAQYQVPPSHPHSYAMPQYYHNNVTNYGRYATPSNFSQTFPTSPAYRYYQTPLISNPIRYAPPPPIGPYYIPSFEGNPRFEPTLTPGWIARPIRKDPPAEVPAIFHVQLPSADAKLWVDDLLTKQKGTDREFETPKLPPGKVFTYTLRATWTENNREISVTKKIDLEPGKETKVILTRPIPDK